MLSKIGQNNAVFKIMVGTITKGRNVSMLYHPTGHKKVSSKKQEWKLGIKRNLSPSS